MDHKQNYNCPHDETRAVYNGFMSSTKRLLKDLIANERCDR
jgi:hypothetical protein